MNGNDSHNHVTDLSSILRTLSSFTTPVQQNAFEDGRSGGRSEGEPGQVSAYNFGTQDPPQFDDQDDYDPEALTIGNGNALWHPNSGTGEARSTSPSSIPAPPPPAVEPAKRTGIADEDPRKIKTWPAALRYTTKILHESPEIAARVRKLVDNQHFNEKQWWAEREKLVRVQAARGEGRANIQQALMSIGVNIDSNSDTKVDESERARQNALELRSYDAKVHRLMQQVAADQDRALAQLRIPFFGLEGSKSAEDTNFMKGLGSLQGRMIEFLEQFVELQ